MLRGHLLAVVLLALFNTSTAGAQSAREIAQRTFPSVVVILTQDSDGKSMSLGSGFFVREDIIATNLHVITGAARGFVRLVGQDVLHEITGVVGQDAERDLALLKVVGLKAQPLLIGDAGQMAVGDDVYAVGNPRGLEGTFSPGMISGIRQTGSETLLQITAPISPGNSGGPILNRKGEVIGLAVATVREGQNLNFAVPVSYSVPLLAFPSRVVPLSKAAKVTPPSIQEPGRTASGVIKIATQSPLSGGQAALGQALTLGAQLAIESQAAQIRAAGFKVELVPFDDEAKPAIGVSNARRIVDDDDILLVIGHLNSGVTLPSLEVYKQADLTIISPANTNPRVTDRRYPNVNRVIGRDDVQGTAAAHFAKRRLRADTAYVIHDRTQYGQETAEFFRASAEQLGIRILGFVATLERADFESLVRQVKVAGPDIIYFGGIYDQAAPFFKQAYESGIKAKFLGPDGMDSSDLVRIAGKAVMGLYYTSAAGPVTVFPMAKEFAETYKKRFGKSPEPYAAEAFDATLVGLQAIRAAITDSEGKQPTRSSVMRAVRRVQAFRGITGTIGFDDKGDRRAAHYFIVEVEAKKPEDWGRNRFVMQLELPPPR